MCSLDLYNWYENRFPNDFNQLVQIKHYNISDLSFLLSKIWCKLDHGEKLLMCAIYYDDFNLARQMLNEKFVFRVNPFFGKRYLIFTPTVKTHLNSTDSMASLNQVDDVPSQAAPCFKHLSKFERRNSYYTKENKSHHCTCYSPIVRHRNLSNNKPPTYYFDQKLRDVYMQSPFYLAVKLNKLKMCELFIEHLKQLNLVRLNNKCCFSKLHLMFSKTNKKKLYLNSILNDNELNKLIVLALSNRNYDISMLILSNINNARQIVNFKNLSESFIYNKEFSMYLITNNVVDAKVLLKESINRHAAETTKLILDYVEKRNNLVKHKLHNNHVNMTEIYTIAINNAIQIGDLGIFLMCMNKMKSSDDKDVQNLANIITVKKVIQQNYNNISKKLTTIAFSTANFDTLLTKSLANSKGIEWNDYFKETDKENQKNISSTSLTYANRLDIFRSLTNTVEHDSYWKSIESSLKDKLNGYEKAFTSDEKFYETSSFLRPKRIHLGRYLYILESEPFLIKHLTSNDKEAVVNNVDLIMVAKHSTCELTLYNLLEHVEFDSDKGQELLEPLDEIQGNFLEIIFCRMVRCTNTEQEMRLRRLFFEAIILKNAKMTCSANLLNLFVTNSQLINNRMGKFYFPLIYYLSSCFLLFKSELHMNRFKLLTNWFVTNNILCLEERKTDGETRGNATLNEQQLDWIIYEVYTKKNSIFNMEMITLKELARHAFMRLYLSEEDKKKYNFLNTISDSVRKFLFYFNELKALILN